MRISIFRTLMSLSFLASIVVALHDSARSVALSNISWSVFGDFLDFFDLIDRESEIILWWTWNADFFNLAERFLLPVPLIGVFGVLSILCYLASYRRSKI